MAGNSNIRVNQRINSDLGKKNFSYKATILWNKVPFNIRALPKLKKFKVEVKIWIKNDVDH